MDRRTFLVVMLGTSLVPAFSSKVLGARGNLKGFMLSSDIRTLSGDINRIADLGGSIVRFPIYLSRTYIPLSEWFRMLDVAYEVTSRRNMTLVIDLHHPSSVEGSVIQDADYFVSVWSQIAQRFSSRRRVWYDLCNEPEPRTPQGLKWEDVALRAARAIRRYDTRHKIVYSHVSDRIYALKNFRPLPGISRQVLQFHFWNWKDDGIQSPEPPFSPYPNGNRFTKATMENRLRLVYDIGQKYGMPIYIGEVGISSQHPNAPRFLRDFLSLCDQFGFPVTIHAYREAPVWNYETNQIPH